jgi:hypothetical protein
VTLQHQDHTRALLPSQPCPQEAAKGGSLAGTSRDRACMSGWNHLYTTFQLRFPFLRADSRYMTVYYESCASTHRDHDGQVSVREGATGNDQARKHDSTHVSYRMNLSCSLFNPSAASDHPTLKRQYGQYRYSAERSGILRDLPCNLCHSWTSSSLAASSHDALTFHSSRSLSSNSRCPS